MATYVKTKKTYYTIAYGNIRRYESDGTTSEFSGIDGVFRGVTERTREVSGEKKLFVDFNFVDGNDNFCISCEKFSGTCNSLARTLVNIPDFSKKVLIETWSREDNGRTYTNVSVKQDGNRISWVDIPAIETFQIQTGETVKSTKKRDDYIESLLEVLNKSVNAPTPNAKQAETGLETHDDLPGDIPPMYEPGYAPDNNYPAYVPNAGV